MNRICIVGIGQMGIIHASILNSLPDSSVVALCDKESLFLKIAKKMLPRMAFYEEYGRMIEIERPDAVYITTPASTHIDLIQGITNTCKVNLFVEKPLATSYHDAISAVNLAQRSGISNTVGYQKRYVATFMKAKELLDKGVLGDVRFFSGHFYAADILAEGRGPKFQKETGGVLLDFGPHILDLTLWYFGMPTSVTSRSVSLFSRDVEDIAHLDLEYVSGVKGSISVGWSMRNFRPAELSMEIHGKNGTISVNEDRLTVYLDRPFLRDLPSGVSTSYAVDLSGGVPFLYAYPEFTLEDIAFIQSLDGKISSGSDFSQASKVNQLIDMARSAQART